MTIDWENPILTKELRTRMRGAKAFWILLLYLGLLSLVLGGTYLSWFQQQDLYRSQTYDMGRLFYSVVFAVQAALVGLITPALTAGALSIEREQRTFEALSVSPLPRRSIVLGKLTSAVGFVGLLLLSSLPLVALCFLLGGVSPQEICAAYVLLFASAFLYGATGIAYSSFAKNTTTSTVLTYGTILLFFFGTLPLALASINFVSASLSSHAEPFLLAVNPVGAMVAGNLTESYFGLAVPSWLVGLTVNGLLGTILTIVALHRIEYPRTDRSGLLRGLTAVFVGLIALLGLGHSSFTPGVPVAYFPLLPLIFVPIFVAGESLPKGSLRKQLFKLKSGNPVSGMTYVAGLTGLVAVLSLLYSALMINCYLPADPSASFMGMTREMLPGNLGAIAVALGAVFGFGALTLLLSQKLKNRWGTLALVFTIMAAVYFLPFSAEITQPGEKHTVFINSLYLSPIAASVESTNYGWGGLCGDGDALAFGRQNIVAINVAFTSLLGLSSLSLLKRARRERPS